MFLSQWSSEFLLSSFARFHVRNVSWEGVTMEISMADGNRENKRMSTKKISQSSKHND